MVFSRAKRHMAVVSSIDPEQITNLYNDGAHCMKRYLQFARAASIDDDITMNQVSRALSRQEAATPRRNPVALPGDALEDEGFVVERNVGTSEFQVDLAVGRDDEDSLSVAVWIDSPTTYADFDPLEHAGAPERAARLWLDGGDRAVEGLARRSLRLCRPDQVGHGRPGQYAFPPPPAIADEPSQKKAVVREPGAHGPIVLHGATVVLTGTFKGYSRAELTEHLRAAGARVATAIPSAPPCWWWEPGPAPRYSRPPSAESHSRPGNALRTPRARDDSRRRPTVTD